MMTTEESILEIYFKILAIPCSRIPTVLGSMGFSKSEIEEILFQFNELILLKMSEVLESKADLIEEGRRRIIPIIRQRCQRGKSMSEFDLNL